MNCANCRNNIPDPPPRSAGIWVEVMRDEYGFGYRPPHFPVSRRRISGRKANSVPPDAHLSFLDCCIPNHNTFARTHMPLDSKDILTMIDEALARRDGGTGSISALRRHFLIDLRTTVQEDGLALPDKRKLDTCGLPSSF